jgi:beta-lactamase regulating signal transducer with metallopeptidase domain
MLAWVLHDALTGALMALGVWLLARPLRRRPAVLHVLWLLVLVRLVVPPLFGPSPFEPLGALAAPTLSAEADPAVFASGLEAARRSSGPVGLAWLGSPAAASLRVGLLLAWALGAAWVLVREGRRMARVRALVGRTSPASAAVKARVSEVAAQLRIRCPGVVTLPGLPSPFVWSLGRPVLVLPADQHLGHGVLAHELAHLRRWDHWVARFELVALALHWWNPVFHLARRELRRNMELACDGVALDAYPAERLSYARSLVEAAERAAGLPRPSLVLGVLGGELRAFESRLRGIVYGEVSRVGWGVCLPLALVAPAFASWEPVLPVELPRPVVEPELGPAERALLTGLGAETWDEALEGASDEARAALALDPDDGSAWRKLAMVQLAHGDYRDALVSLEQQALAGHAPSNAWYNRACAHSRLGEVERAFEALERCLEAQGLAPSALADDPDLASLKGDPRFEGLLARARVVWASL